MDNKSGGRSGGGTAADGATSKVGGTAAGGALGKGGGLAGGGSGSGTGPRGPMMKAPGSDGSYITREAFERNPQGYFSDLHAEQKAKE